MAVQQAGISKPRHEWLFGLLISSFVLLLCLVAGEAALRQWFPIDKVILQPDSRYLYKFLSNSRELISPVTESGAPPVLITINSQGRRGELVRNDGRPRIIVYGDSFIAAEGTPLKQTFAARLEQLLSAKLTHPVHVINAGVPGYGPDQESLVMEDEIDSLKPSLVILAIYSGNDFGDLVRNKLFQLDERQRLAPNHPALDSTLMQAFADADRQQPSFQLLRRLKKLKQNVRTSAATQPVNPGGLLDAWLAQSQKEYTNYVVDHDSQVHNLFLDGYDADISTDPQSASARYKTALMEGVIERIHAIAARRSVPLVILIIPSPVDALDDWDVSVDSHRFPQYRRSALTDALEKIVKTRDLDYVDLFEPFRAHERDDLYYHALDDHWNAAGQHLAAALTVEYISRREALRKALTR